MALHGSNGSDLPQIVEASLSLFEPVSVGLKE